MANKAKSDVSKESFCAQDLRDVSDNPEWTEQDFASARPAREVLDPRFMAAVRRKRGPQRAPTKQLVSVRLDRDVIEGFKADGPGWQSRINEALRKSLAQR